jgi:hypothetical protein
MPDTPTTETTEPTQPTQPTGAPTPGPAVDDHEAARRAMTSDDFLVPGPTPTSNEGLRRWGCSWLAFSVVLILLMLLITYICWLLARVTGIA